MKYIPVIAVVTLLISLYSSASEVGPHLVRHALNPLLNRGETGDFDQLKIGPRAILRESKNDWKMWYEGAFAGNQASVGYATSTDGLKWEKYAGNPIMLPSETWEGGKRGEICPKTVLKEGNIYKMWYHAYREGVRRIGYAESTDGIRWKKFGNNPVLDVGTQGSWDSRQIAEPTVLKIGTKYYMWYMGLSAKNNKWQTGLAISTDGISWIKYVNNPVLKSGGAGSWDDGSVLVGGIIWDGEIFHHWYRSNQFVPNGGIGYAKSTDGINWMKISGNPLLFRPDGKSFSEAYGVGGGINAITVDDKNYIYYSCMVFCCPENMSVCLAVSN